MRVWYVALPIVVAVLGSAQGCSPDVTGITPIVDTPAVASDLPAVSSAAGTTSGNANGRRWRKPRNALAETARSTSRCGSNVAVRWIRPVLEQCSASFQVLQDQMLSQNDCLLDARCGRQAMILVRHSPLLSRLPATPRVRLSEARGFVSVSQPPSSRDSAELQSGHAGDPVPREFCRAAD